MKLLSKAIISTQNLGHLGLIANKIGVIGTKHFAKRLFCISKLEVNYLSNNEISVKVIKYLVEKLTSIPNLRGETSQKRNRSKKPNRRTGFHSEYFTSPYLLLSPTTTSPLPGLHCELHNIRPDRSEHEHLFLDHNNNNFITPRCPCSDAQRNAPPSQV